MDPNKKNIEINDEIMSQIKATIEHKKFVIDSGLKMSIYLFEHNQTELGFQLIDRIFVHDNSKLAHDELYGLSSISNRCALTNPNVLLSNEQEKIVKLHWKNNRHHPEFFNSFDDMSELDIIEMCCDWHARSTQYKTDLMDFVYVRQENRFHFSKEMFDKIVFYCEILLK